MLGQTISHYRIVEKIGEGGMGVVYKAEDTTLGRTVALKFLAPLNADGAEARERFLREASAAAALDHPNICTVHEIGEADGKVFLAMAFVDGVSISEKIRDRPLRLGEALDIAIQTGEGLRAAHAKGIVHRDVKSANIMVTREGQVKIMDFGLAHLDNRSRLTRTATVVGTPAYMSPEQAQALDTDRRTDIWSLGVLLYVMTTGREPFEGPREESVLYSIVHREPEPITALRVGVPPELDRIVGKALAKNRDERYQHVDDILVDLAALRKKITSGESMPSTSTPQSGTRRPYLLYVALAILSLFSLALSVIHFREPAASDSIPHRRFALTPDSLIAANGSAAISPDGKHVAYVGAAGLWVWDMNRDQPRKLAGTEGARGPFWSPDSFHIGFFVGNRVRKVPIDGGPPVAVGSPPASTVGGGVWRGAWSEDGASILFANGTLFLLGAQGGTPKPVERDVKAKGILNPIALPLEAGPRMILADVGGTPPRIVVMNWETGETRPVIDGAQPVFSPTGHILFQPDRDRREIWAVPFSLEKLRSTGEPFPIVAEGGSPSVSRDGTLVFVDGFDRNVRRLVTYDRLGVGQGAAGYAHPGLAGPTLSPDSGRVAFVGDRTIWVLDVRRGVPARLTFGPENHILPRWSPSGSEIAYSAYQSGSWNVVIRQADGAGEARTVAGAAVDEYASDWSRDGNHIMLTVGDRSFDLWYLKRLPDGRGFERLPLLVTDFMERAAKFSPDGRLFTYCSNETGRDEVYVRSFPQGEAKRQVSHNGGCRPTWSADGKEIFYVDEDATLWSAPVRTEPNFAVETPQRLFRNQELTAGLSPYSVSADGKRFLLAIPVEDPQRKPPSLRVMQNWFADFRTR